MVQAFWMTGLSVLLLGGDNGELAKALREAAAMSSYRFRIEERPGSGGGGGPEGRYQKGRPVFFKADNLEFFKQGDTLSYKQGGQWKKTKRGVESDPLVILGASAKVSRARLPHEELAGFEKNFKDVSRSDAKGKDEAVYSGELTEEAVKKLVPTEYRGVARSGTAKLWLDSKGRVARYAISIKVQGRQGNAEIDGTTEKTVVIQDIGSARVEVPEEAKKALLRE